jgi:Nitrile hydratase beta subunit, N-terminal
MAKATKAKQAKAGSAALARPDDLIARGHHDMGGLPAGRVVPSEHDYAEWERRVDALMVLLSGVKGGPPRITVDELRKNIEAIGPEAYDKMSYYERWVTSLTQSMIQRGVITTDELGRKMEEIRARGKR